MFISSEDQPYVYKDAIFMSAHKFVGGVQTPGTHVELKERNLPTNTISLVDAQTDIFIFIQYCGKETDFQSFLNLLKVSWWQRKSFSRIKYQTTVEEGLYFM